jgi:heme/copper-type cytochrome/quinol oxidase subunit 1
VPFTHAARRRLSCAGVLAAVIALGVASRAAPLGWLVYDKSLGDVLYAVAAYYALAVLMPRLPVVTVAALATAACFVVEFLQLTEVNQRLLTVPVLRWFLGTTFLWHDLVCYLAGVAVAACLDARCLPRRLDDPSATG